MSFTVGGARINAPSTLDGAGVGRVEVKVTEVYVTRAGGWEEAMGVVAVEVAGVDVTRSA